MLAGDEVVVSKSGKQTYGLDRFFSSLASKPISGLSFFVLLLLSVEGRQSLINSTWAIKTVKPQEKRERGRPKGSKNKKKTEVILTSELLLIKKMIHSLLKLVVKMLPEIPEPILLTQIFAKLTALGRIHPVSTGVEPS